MGVKKKAARITVERLCWVKVTRTVDAYHYKVGDILGSTVQLNRGEVLGNVYGHTRGIEVYPNRDGTKMLILRGDFIDTWERIPGDALEHGPVMPVS